MWGKYENLEICWKLTTVCSVHERGDDSDSKQLKGNYWKLIFWKRQCLCIVNCVYALSMSLLHVDDDDCDENDCTLVMVYIFSKCLKVLFYRAPPCYIYSRKTSKVNHEIGPTRNWFSRREFKLIRRGLSWKRRFFCKNNTFLRNKTESKNIVDVFL